MLYFIHWLAVHGDCVSVAVVRLGILPFFKGNTRCLHIPDDLSVFVDFSGRFAQPASVSDTPDS